MQEYVNIAEGVLSTLCQCMTRESCCNYFLSLDSIDLLMSMTMSSLFQVSNNAKMVLSSLSHYLAPEYRSCFKLTMEEFADMMQSLDMVLNRGVIEGELFFSALEILQSFKLFIQFEPNREIMVYSTVYKSIASLLERGDTMERSAACELLWKLVTKPISEDTVVITGKKKNKMEDVEVIRHVEYMSEPGVRSFLLQNYPEMLVVLSTLTEGMESQSTLHYCTRLVLLEENEIIGKGMV